MTDDCLMDLPRLIVYTIPHMRDISPTLRSLGFLDSEIKTYIAALELGPSTVIEIGAKTNLSRQAIYTAIDSLVKQGLMSSVEKGKKQLYAAESPDRLRSIAEAKLKLMESTVKEIKTATDELKLVQRGDKPIVKMFEGKEGLLTMVEEMAKSKTNRVDDFVNDDAVSRIFSDEDLLPIKTALDKFGIQTRVLVLAREKSIPTRKSTKSKNITRKDLAFDGEITIFADKVGLSSLKGNKLMGVLIENHEIAQALRCMFQMAWDQTP